MLKGDVLAHMGNIEADYSKKQSERIAKMGHLDLSNIKIAKAEVGAGATTGPAVVPEVDSTPKLTTVAITVSLAEVLKVQQKVQTTLGITMPLSAFLARAVDEANDGLPLVKGAKPSADALFNAVLGLDKVPTTSRGTYIPQITALPSIYSAPSSPRPKGSNASKKPVDIIDVLSGKARPARSAAGRAALGAKSSSVSVSGDAEVNTFSLDVPLGEEKRARTFLERMKTVLQVEPARLVL